MSVESTTARTSRRLSSASVIHVCLAGFVASTLVGVWAAPERASALVAMNWIVGGAGAYVLAWALGRKHAALDTAVLVATVLASVAAAAFFLAQYRYLVIVPKVAIIDTIGRAISAPFRQYAAWAPVPNSLGTLIEGPLCVALGLTLARGSWLVRGFAALSALVLTLTSAAAASRGSWLAVVAAAILATWIRSGLVTPSIRIVGPLVAVACLAVVGAVTAAGEIWWVTLASAAGRPDRLDVYVDAITLLRDAPFTGIGAGDQFATALSKYALLIQVPFLTYSHNLWLEIWLEQGLPGLAAWLALAAAVVTTAHAGERAGLGWRFRGLWMGLAAIHLHGLTDARQSVDPWTWIPFFVLMGAFAAAATRHDLRLPRGAALAPLTLGVAVVATVIIARGPLRASWHANLGALEQARGDFGDDQRDSAVARAKGAAENEFRQALSLNPADPSALRRLGLLELDADRHAEALDHLRRAWSVDPSSKPTRKAYGLAAMWSEDIELAARLLGPSPGITDELNAWSHWRQSRGESALAISAARTSLALDPSQAAVEESLARLQGTPPP